MSTSGRFCWADDRMASWPAHATPDCPAATLIGGHWPSCYVLLFGRGVTVTANPYDSTLFSKGIVQLRVEIALDVLLPIPQQVQAGGVHLGKSLANDEEYTRWSESVASWNRYTLGLIRRRLTEVDPLEFDTAVLDSRRWQGYNDDHREGRSYLSVRLELLRGYVRRSRWGIAK